MSGIALLVRRSLRQHALSTTVTVGSAALACGLVVAVFSIQAQARAAFTGVPGGFDAVLGARGSQLQLVLNAVFHLETSPGNIPWRMYQEVKRDPAVKAAVPYAVGDNYRGFRLVGTSEEIFQLFELPGGRSPRPAPGGRIFDSRRREAVLGDFAARGTGLRVGDTFHAYHGLVFDEQARHDEDYTVVGVLEPTNSPLDRVILVPIEGVFRMGGHVLRGAGENYEPKPEVPIPEEHKEVSAVLLKLRAPQHGMLLQQRYNTQGTAATLAWPVATVVAEFLRKFDWITRVLELLAYLVMIVAAGSILASIHNSMNERRREFAILRALGASRATVSAAIVAEAGTIAAAGGLLGLFVHAAVLAGAAAVVRAQTGVVMEWLRFHPAWVLAPAGMVVLGTLAGLLPARNAYRTDVATNLAPQA